MENSKKIKVIQYYWKCLKRDCPCTYSEVSGKITVDDAERMPNKEQEKQWELEYDSRINLTDQKETCIQNLKDTDYMLLSDFEYKEDLPDLLIKRSDWKRILKSDKLEEMPPKTFN